MILISQNQLSLVFGRTQHIPDGIKLVGQIVDQNRGVVQMVHSSVSLLLTFIVSSPICNSWLIIQQHLFTELIHKNI